VYRLIKLLAGVGLLAVLLWLLDWRAAAAAVAGADPYWVAAAFLATVMGVLVSAGKWHGLLRDSGIAVGRAVTARLYWIGMFFSNFLPTSVGGDAVRLVLTPSNGRMERVAGSIVIERMTGLLVLLGLSAAGLALRPWAIAGNLPHGALLATLLVMTVGALTILVVPALVARLLARLIAPLPRLLQRPLRKVHRVTVTLARQAQRWPAVARALLLSFPFYGTVLLAQYAVLRAVDAQVELGDVLLLGSLVPLLGVLPVSINGLGVAEGVFVAVYASVGAVPELALAAAALRRLVDVANSAIGGLFWLARPGGDDARAAAARGGAVRPVALAAHR
jgi:glycosyltransferase 2 family protein